MYKLLQYPKPGASQGVANTWDDKYQAEDFNFKEKVFERQIFWPLLKQQLTLGGRYLDAGCGRGGWVWFLSKRGYEISGIDIALGTLERAKQKHPGLQLSAASITNLPQADNSLDGVLVLGTFEYLEDQLQCSLAEVHRVLKPGGWIFIEAPLLNLLRLVFYLPVKTVERVFKRFLGSRSTFAYYLFSRQELEELLRTSGFTVHVVQPHELPDQNCHFGLYTDWRILRGRKPYQLNWAGRAIKTIANFISPWLASTGVVVVATKSR